MNANFFARFPADRNGLRRRSACGTATAAVLIGKPLTEAQAAAAATGKAPRFEFLELAQRLQGDVVSIDRWGSPWDAVARRTPLTAASLAAGLQAGRWRAIYATGEDLGLRLGTLTKLRRWQGRLVCVAHACLSERRKAYFRALGHETFHAVICVSEAQRDVLVTECGFPPEKVHAVFNWVDTEFFRPTHPHASGRASVFACGLENRDYRSLLSAAAQAPDVRFTIAASGFNGAGELPAISPSNVTILRRRIPFTELRAAYSEAQIVVVPLNAVPYAAGVTGLLEAMAMARPVVVTASPGIQEYLQAPRGAMVRPGDAGALGKAIRQLIERPDLCREIGARNRRWCEENATIEGYVDRVARLMT
jgi:glycosyltransferase involved in cell wall biosynthesis